MTFGLSAGTIGLISAGASLAGGLMASGSAGDAANAQISAANASSAQTAQATKEQQARLQPWVNTGGAANNALSTYLGLGGQYTGGYTPKTAEQLRQEFIGQYTYKGGAAPGANNMSDSWNALGYGVNGNGSLNFGDQHEADDSTRGYGSAGMVDEAGLSAAVQAALAAQGPATQRTLDPNYGKLTKQFDSTDLANDLVYQNGLKYGLDTGLSQINNRAAAGGTYGSGAALKALVKFGNDYGTTKTEGAYNRNAQDKNQLYGFLSGQSAQGQSAAAGQGAAGLSGAQTIAGNTLAAGNAASAGIVGGANGVNSGIGSATNALQWQQLLNKNTPSSSYSGGGTYAGLPVLQNASPYGNYNGDYNSLAYN